MSGFNFPFSSPSVPDASTFDSNTISSPVTPQTPTPDSLPIFTNPFKYLVANNPSNVDTNACRAVTVDKHTHQPDRQGGRAAEDKNPFHAITTPEHKAQLYQQVTQANAEDNSYHAITSPIAVPAKVVTRSRASSIPSFQHGSGRRFTTTTNPNPFSDDHALVIPPSKPWLNNLHSNGSEVESIASSATFHTAAPAGLTHQSSRHGLLSNISAPSLTTFKSTHSRTDIAKTLKLEAIVREVKLHERKLEIEQTKEKLKRLASNASKSQLSAPLKGQTLWKRIYLLKHPVFGKIVRDVWFWLMVLLFQCGVVSIAACIGVIYSYDRYGNKVKPAPARVFWLVCSIAAMLIGLVFCIIICIKNGNCCLGAQDKMGFNEIRDLDNSNGDVEMGRGPGLLYLGVGDREEGSVLGRNKSQAELVDRTNPHSKLSVRSALKAHGLSPRHYETAWDFLDSFAQAGQWPSDGPSIEDTIRDPEWHDLYVTSEPTKYGGSQGTGGRGRSKLRNGGEIECGDIGEQRMMPTKNSESSKMSAARGQGLFLSRVGEGKDLKTVPLENKSLLSVVSSIDGYASGGRKEVQGWSPLDRFTRILTGKLPITATKSARPTNSATSNPAKKSSFTEEFELAPLRVSPPNAQATKDGKSGHGMTPVTEQTMEYPWSPAVVEARMKKRMEEREKLKLREGESKIEDAAISSDQEGSKVIERGAGFTFAVGGESDSP